jgi:TRAP-type C4-dicarboxylate transport system permease large subunit
MLREAVGGAVQTTCVILVIVCAAKLFSQLLSFAGATRGLVALIGELGLGPDMTFLLMMLVPFVLCMFIDQIAFMLLAVPIYVPLVAAQGYDPIWFWTLFLVNLTVGSLTPPFGYTLFALKGASDLTTREVFAAAWPVVGIFVAGMAILWAAPWIVTAIPNAIR